MLPKSYLLNSSAKRRNTLAVQVYPESLSEVEHNLI